MKYLSVLVLAVAFSVSSAEAGCRGGLFGGKLRGNSCGSSCAASCKTSCGNSCGRTHLLHGRQSCCASGCSTAAPAKADAPKGAEKPKVSAPSTK